MPSTALGVKCRSDSKPPMESRSMLSFGHCSPKSKPAKGDIRASNCTISGWITAESELMTGWENPACDILFDRVTVLTAIAGEGG